MRSPPPATEAPLVWSPSLFDVEPLHLRDDVPGASSCAPGDPRPDAGFARLAHHDLGDGAWIEHQPGWLGGSAALFDELVAGLDWGTPEVPMYGQMVRQPRRSAWLRLAEVPDALPTAARTLPLLAELVGRRYRRRFTTVGANLYRDRRDSVAWHGDRVHRDRHDAVIAIVSLGSARPFRLRPIVGGASIGFELGHGDLLVMGGTCQRTWQHAVPKVSRPVGPRLSVTFRHPQPVRPELDDGTSPRASGAGGVDGSHGTRRRGSGRRPAP